MRELRARGRQGRAIGGTPDRQPLDDWLGEVSDEDWSEDAAELAAGRRATPARPDPEHAEWDLSAGSPAPVRPVAATETRRAAVERRRAVAGLVLLLLIGIAAAAAVVALRDGAEAPLSESPTVTSPAPTETDAVSTTPTTTTPTTTTPTAPSGDAPSFALPEGTKLQRGEDAGESDLTVSTDTELIESLQRALVRAGYDPGTPDGTFGEATEAAVIAFQEANGLAPDGIVGPETAEALSRAIAGG